MEDFRNGKLAVRRGIPGIKPRSRRVLVAGGLSGPALETVFEFRQKGCRVAVFDSDEEEGRRMAYRHGVRFHHVDINDKIELSNATYSLLEVWRGIDVVVGEEGKCGVIKQRIEEWKNSLPLPDLSEVEFVIII